MSRRDRRDDEQIVIIVGAPRSGTNMLRNVLARLPGIGTWPCDEINPMWKHGNRRSCTTSLTHGHARPEVVADLQQRFQRFGRRARMPVLVEKTCATSLRVGFAAAVFPDAKFIFIHRHGLDAAASTAKRWNAAFNLPYTVRKARYVPVSDVPAYASTFVRDRYLKWRTGASERDVTTWWGPRPHDYHHLQRTHGLPDLAAIQWQRCVQASRRDLGELGDSVHRVAYEDFVTQPRTELSRILGFIERPDAMTTNAVDDVRTRSAGKARDSLGESTRVRLAARMADDLEALGHA